MNYSRDLQRRRRWFRFNYTLIVSAVLLIIAGLLLQDWQPATPAYYSQHQTDYLRVQQKLLTQPNVLSNTIWVRGSAGTTSISLGESVGPSGVKTYRLTAEINPATGQTASIESSPVMVAPKTTYVYEDDYLASVNNHLEIEEFKADRTPIGKQTLYRYPAASVSRRFSNYFTTSPETSLIVVRRSIDESGRLSIESQRLRQSPIAGFSQGMVTFTFDGGYSSAQSVALQELQTNGIQGTFYVQPGVVGQAGRLTEKDLRTIRSAGSEIAANGLLGRDLTGLDPVIKNDEIAKAREKLADADLGTADLFAAPYGALDGEAKQLLRRHYRSNRSLNDQSINYPFDYDPFAVKAFAVTSKTETAEIARLVEHTAATGGWLVLVYQDFGDENADTNATVNVARFRSHLQAVIDSKIPVKSMSQALESVDGYFKERL